MDPAANGPGPGFKTGGPKITTAHAEIAGFYQRLGFRLVGGRWVMFDRQKRVSIADEIRRAESSAAVWEMMGALEVAGVPERARRKLRLVAVARVRDLESRG